MGAALKSSNKGLVSRRALSKAASTSFVHGIGICTSRSQSPEFAVGFQHSIIVAVLPLCPQLLPEFLDCSSHLDAKTRAAAIEFRKAISPKRSYPPARNVELQAGIICCGLWQLKNIQTISQMSRAILSLRNAFVST